MTDALGGVTPYSGATHAPGGFRQAIVSSAAAALGMSTQDVQSALRNGQSLADLAQQKGVSNDTLVGAVAQGLQAATSGSSAVNGDVTSIAQDIVNRKGVGGPHHHHHHGAVGSATSSGSDPDGDGDSDAAGETSDTSSSPFTALSGLLGMSQGDLLSALESGTSLPSLLQQQGLSQQSLDALPAQGLAVDTTA